MITVSIYEGSKKVPEIKNIEKTVLKIGRAAENDIVLDDAGVSKHHAEIHKRANGFFVSDLKSSNGTFVNGHKIPARTRVPFQSDEVIIIGVYRLNVENGADPAEEPTALAGSEKQKLVVQAGSGTLKRSFEEALRYYRDPQIIDLKVSVHQRLLEIIDLRRLDVKSLSDEELRKQCEAIVRNIIKKMPEKIPAKLDREEFVKDILDEAIGLGPLEDLLADPAVSEIMVNRSDQIYIELKGRLVLSPKIFSSDVSVMGVISRIVTPIGRRIDESSPLVDARLKDGSRVNAIIPPLALNGPSITIRKFSKIPLVTENLIQFKSLTPAMAEFIENCVKYKKNIVVSGGTGSGKTTLLNIFSSYIPSSERIVTIEDSAELQLSQDHVVRLESRPANIEGKGAIPIRELVRNALRMRPDRIVVGECRGGEALDMLQAMNTGHDGSLTTGHANSPRDMLARLETMVLMAGEDLPSRAIREQISSAVDFIVQQSRLSCGSRKVISISEVVGIEDGRVMLQEIFYFKQEGFDDAGNTQGTFLATGWIPDFYQDLQKRGIKVNMNIFHN